MRWQIKWQNEDLTWLEQLEEDGIVEDPQALRDRPELFPHLALVWQAFFDANTSRPIGMGGVGGISPTDIEAEIRRFQIEDPDEREIFYLLVRGLDNEYLTAQSEKSKEESRQRSNKQAGK